MKKRKYILKKDFFIRPTLEVAEEILGKYLVRSFGENKMEGMITEVEAYDGPDDKANHASIGKTKRNEVMYESGGHIYVYLTYGIHNMLNLVTGEEGYPAAILIRSTEQVSGPGRLTKFYHIDRSLNRLEAKAKNGLWIEDRGVEIGSKDIKRTPRVGVQYAGETWAGKPYRFILKDFFKS
jgi:DNA-3-methyladenine glycosylase